MTIKVYWACLEKEWFRAEEPLPVSNLFYKDKKYDRSDPGFDMFACPSFNNHLNNVFALKSIYSYSFNVDDKGQVYSDQYDQEFFNRHVVIKSLKNRLFSFDQRLVFFTDEDSLKVTLCEHPFFEDNEVTKRCMQIPGELDIAKWYRNTNMMFFLKKEYDSFKINEGEIYSYIRFHTDEDIKFIQYRNNDTLSKYMDDTVYSRFNKRKVLSIEKYYSMFKTKKFILDEIKRNLVS